MPLQSKLFAGIARSRLVLCKTRPNITLNAKGDHVSKIQTALFVPFRGA
jgi:hypothetical protein